MRRSVNAFLQKLLGGALVIKSEPRHLQVMQCQGQVPVVSRTPLKSHPSLLHTTLKQQRSQLKGVNEYDKHQVL